MSDAVLGILKNCVLALLFLFLLRVVFVVAKELRGTPQLRDAATPPVATAPAPPATAVPKTTRWKVVMRGADRPREFPVRDELTVGRGGGCTISLPDDTFVSTVHARIFTNANELWVEDLNSTNGTAVNGNTISAPTRLRKGDVVRIGSTELEAAR